MYTGILTVAGEMLGSTFTRPANFFSGSLTLILSQWGGFCTMALLQLQQAAVAGPSATSLQNSLCLGPRCLPAANLPTTCWRLLPKPVFDKTSIYLCAAALAWRKITYNVNQSGQGRQGCA